MRVWLADWVVGGASGAGASVLAVAAFVHLAAPVEIPKPSFAPVAMARNAPVVSPAAPIRLHVVPLRTRVFKLARPNRIVRAAPIRARPLAIIASSTRRPNRSAKGTARSIVRSPAASRPSVARAAAHVDARVAAVVRSPFHGVPERR